MDYKDNLRMFAEMVCTVLLFAFVVFYVIIGDRIYWFTGIMKSLMPLSIFGLPLVIKYFFAKKIIKGQDPREVQVTLNLHYGFKMTSDILTFLIPLGILAVAQLGSRSITMIDLAQAVFAMVVLHVWNRALFVNAIY